MPTINIKGFMGDLPIWIFILSAILSGPNRAWCDHCALKGPAVSLVPGFGKMAFVTALGLIAGFLTTISFLPQVIRTWRSRSTRDISLGTYLIYVSGIVLWLIYGLVLNDVALIASNAVTLLLASTILGLKLKHG
jgi:MtN3 and saliva related transmembrane protein